VEELGVIWTLFEGRRHGDAGEGAIYRGCPKKGRLCGTVEWHRADQRQHDCYGLNNGVDDCLQVRWSHKLVRGGRVQS